MENEPICVQDVEAIARQRLPKDRLAYFESGAGEEVTLNENRQAFQRIKLRPRMLRGVAEADIATTILGQPISMPICIAPTAYHKMAHPDGEIATAKAAVAYETCMTLSYAANSSIEDVAEAVPFAIKWFAMEFNETNDYLKKTIRKLEQAGFQAIVLVCDSQIIGKRFSYERINFKFPSNLPIPTLEILGVPNGLDPSEGSKVMNRNKPALAWNHVKQLKSYTKLPIILKGILTSEDAQLAVESGVDAILVSNHGGRQLDGVPATIDVLAEIVDAVQGRLEVYLDGGVRLGTDVFKALALGARAVFVGRPVIWGLAYDGENGVKKVLGFLREELRTAMILSGCGRKPAGTRIVGGEEARPNSWPWQLSLKVRGGHNCGASLLTPTWALTAAHCVAGSNNPRDYTVSAGAHFRQNDGMTLRVARIIPHPRYHRNHLRHDFALLRLAQPAQLNRKVQTICLPRHGDRARPGGRCYIAGWGRIDPNDLYRPSDRLKQAYMPIVDHRTCIRRNGRFVDETTMVCVGGQGHSACNGDSGGPLMCQENGRWVLRGVASWVTNLTCPGNAYSVYARVSEHVNWIYQNMRG